MNYQATLHPHDKAIMKALSKKSQAAAAVPGAKFYVATLETHSFNFTAYSATSNGATAKMKAAWNKHRREYSHCDNMWKWKEIRGDMNMDEVVLEQAYRDGMPI